MEILSFSKTRRMVMWERLWTYNREPNPEEKRDGQVVEAYESPAPDCPMQRKSFNAYNPFSKVLLPYLGFVVTEQKNPGF